MVVGWLVIVVGLMMFGEEEFIVRVFVDVICDCEVLFVLVLRYFECFDEVVEVFVVILILVVW